MIRLATERMVRAIEEITLNQGVDPRDAVLVGGGGAAGLNAVAIARRLGSPRVLIPALGAVLSAAGALMSELSTDFTATLRTSTTAFDIPAVNRVLDGLRARCLEFLDGPGRGAASSTIEFSVEARYPHQIWELDVPLAVGRFNGQDDVERLRHDFHDVHEELFAIRDPDSAIETVAWRARVRCRLREEQTGALVPALARSPRESATRRAWFPDVGNIDVSVRTLESLQPGDVVVGPAIVESPVTTVVVDPGASGELLASGTLVIDPWAASGSPRRSRPDTASTPS
jgi:N-methylhydantoinase A